jgi:hypothetical protein
VFSCGGRDFTVRDVIDAAHFRGELEPFWRTLLLRQAAEEKAAATDAEPDETAIDEAAVAFRYQYDLITAEETEAWLEARGLTLSDFSEYFARVQWGEMFAGRIDPPAREFADARAEERELLAADLILGGDFDPLAARLAWRVAAFDAANGEVKEEEQPLARLDAAAIGRDENWLQEMSQMEAAYRARCEQRLSAEARQRELGSLRLPLTRFDVEMIELESRDAASEAFLCVRDDGMSMQEVAEEGRYPFRRTELVLEQIPDDLQQKFLSSTPGSLLEPTAREDGYILTKLVQKKEPSLDDPEVRARVERRILERHFSDVSSGRIQWRIMMNGAE